MCSVLHEAVFPSQTRGEHLFPHCGHKARALGSISHKDEEVLVVTATRDGGWNCKTEAPSVALQGSGNSLLKGLINPHTNVGHFSFKRSHVRKLSELWHDQQAKCHVEREDNHLHLTLDRKIRISRDEAIESPPPPSKSLPSVAHWGLQKALEVWRTSGCCQERCAPGCWSLWRCTPPQTKPPWGRKCSLETHQDQTIPAVGQSTASQEQCLQDSQKWGQLKLYFNLQQPVYPQSVT